MSWEVNCTRVGVYMTDLPFEVVGEAYVAQLSGPLDLTLLLRQVAHDVHRYMADHAAIFSRRTAILLEVEPAWIDDDSALQDVRLTMSGELNQRLMSWTLETNTWRE